MREDISTALAGLRTVLSAAAFAALAGCAAPIMVSTASVAEPAEFLPQTYRIGDAPAEQTTTIEARTYPGSPTVAVVAWEDDDTGFGLRTWVRRDGTPSPDHRLYVSTMYSFAGASFNRAAVPAGPLKLTGVTRDEHSCVGGNKTCSPYITFGARITDEELRAHRDGMEVTFYARDGRMLPITVSPELIDAYLCKVDSVTAALRKKAH